MNKSAQTVLRRPSTLATCLAAVVLGACSGKSSSSQTTTGTGPPPKPTPDFRALVTSGPGPLDVTFKNLTANGGQWSWDFGELIDPNDPSQGTYTSAAFEPVHQYTVPGVYDVTLTATGVGGIVSATKVDYVTTLPGIPKAEFGVVVVEAHWPATAHFADLTDPILFEPHLWLWDFGDGTPTSTEQNPTHVYQDMGVYSVTLTVGGPGGTDTEVKPGFIVVVERPPIPEFSSDALPSSQAPAPPYTVNFFNDTTFGATASGPIDQYTWNFGNGVFHQTSNVNEDPSHTYQEPGAYTVVLRGDGPGGRGKTTKTDHVRIPPVPFFAAQPGSGALGPPSSPSLSVLFDPGATVGVVYDYLWDFDPSNPGASTSTDRDPVYPYTTPGEFDVELTVTGPGGARAKTAADVVKTYLPIVDASFESQGPGTPPGGGWINTNAGGGHVVMAAAEIDMPTAGNKWAQLSSGASGPATAPAPTNPPGGQGVQTAGPAVGAAGIEHSFSYMIDAVTEGRTVLQFDTAFLANDPVNNDWFSVDVTDGSQWFNVHFRDSSSPVLEQDQINVAPLAQLSIVHGIPMTPTETVVVQLASLFPNADQTTVFSLRAQVGNDADNQAPSYAYLDRFRWTKPSVVSGVNLAATYTNSSGQALPPSGEAPLVVDFVSSVGAGSATPTRWLWDFGDGFASNSQDPSHHYALDPSSPSNNAQFSVSLSSGADGGTGYKAARNLVTIFEPGSVAKFSVFPLGAPTSAYIGTVAPAQVNLPLTLQNDTDESMLPSPVDHYHWDFGDGSPGVLSGPLGSGGATTVSHPNGGYTLTGSSAHQVCSGGLAGTAAECFDITLSVCLDAGCASPLTLTQSSLVELYPQPDIQFSVSGSGGVAPYTVGITNLSKHGTAWNWVFGDGNSSPLKSPTSHTYQCGGGSYDMSLTVTGLDGNEKWTELLTQQGASAITTTYPPPDVTLTVCRTGTSACANGTPASVGTLTIPTAATVSGTAVTLVDTDVTFTQSSSQAACGSITNYKLVFNGVTLFDQATFPSTSKVFQWSTPYVDKARATLTVTAVDGVTRTASVDVDLADKTFSSNLYSSNIPGNCTACHPPNGVGFGSSCDTAYTAVMDYTTGGSLSGGVYDRIITSNMGSLSTAEKEEFVNWILDGAKAGCP